MGASRWGPRLSDAPQASARGRRRWRSPSSSSSSPRGVVGWGGGGGVVGWWGGGCGGGWRGGGVGGGVGGVVGAGGGVGGGGEWGGAFVFLGRSVPSVVGGFEGKPKGQLPLLGGPLKNDTPTWGSQIRGLASLLWHTIIQ